VRIVCVLPDQLSRDGAAFENARPADTRVLIVDALPAVSVPRWHRQRVAVQTAAVRHFAAGLQATGFQVEVVTPDEPTDPASAAPLFLPAALAACAGRHGSSDLFAEEPTSWADRESLRKTGVRLVPTRRFQIDYDEFAEWAEGRRRLVMDTFYRRQRRRLGYLMEEDEPAGGRWSFDRDNRRPQEPGMVSPTPQRSRPDHIDAAAIESVTAPHPHLFGDPPDGLWPTTRRRALARLRHFVSEVLPAFGPHQDAMVAGDWHLAHSLLSPALNLGLLHPAEVCDAVDRAWRRGDVPLPSAEGFVRQLIGWRDYVWCVYRWRMPAAADENALEARAPLPPALWGEAPTRMSCLSTVLDDIARRAYAHHIQRLIVLGNLALLAGIDPKAMTDWMLTAFVDGHHWAMVPNVVGMACWADGGVMATKPYAAGGHYISRMSDYCGDCPFDPAARVGDRACPYSTLYWDFLIRHRDRLARVHRLRPQLASAQRLPDRQALRDRAADVRAMLTAGEL